MTEKQKKEVLTSLYSAIYRAKEALTDQVVKAGNLDHYTTCLRDKMDHIREIKKSIDNVFALVPTAPKK